MVIRLNGAFPGEAAPERELTLQGRHADLLLPSPSSSSVLTHLIPHSMPVKGQKLWLLVAHANFGKCERYDGEGEGVEDGQRPRPLKQWSPTRDTLGELSE